MATAPHPVSQNSSQPNSYVEIHGLKVAEIIYNFVRDELCPGSGVSDDHFWESMASIIYDLEPKNRELLEKRIILQRRIDDWYRGKHGRAVTPQQTRGFLEGIDYIVPEGDDFKVKVDNVDDEITTIAAPQLVVPTDNARYALNAANARWGSLFDALYGTDVIDESGGAEKSGGYNPVRGQRVFDYANGLLDESIPLAGGSWSAVTGLSLTGRDDARVLTVTLGEEATMSLADQSRFAGFIEKDGELKSVLLKHNDLHIEIQIDRDHPVGKTHAAGIKDIVLEAAATTICDFEDSVAAVDADDKYTVYHNWLGLMKGDLTAELEKGGKTITRAMNPDRVYTAADGGEMSLHGRSMLFVRNCGPHMYTDCVMTQEKHEVPEGFIDCVMSVLAAKHNLDGNCTRTNSRTGSVYIVKPKLHGPEEVAATIELFGRVEQALDLPAGTIKIGIMDEERRTTLNLKECIRRARDRVVFINTGFLDRTGDEIHTVMAAGPFIPKGEIKSAKWILAYEDWNVDIGLETGLPGNAQIGKGMWAMPDEMKAMMEAKIGHPQAGANTAWVPSPTAATLHAMHYHKVNVHERQRELAGRERVDMDDLLTLALLGDRKLSDVERLKELDSNAQSLMGYVVRWVQQGVGCSKIPDINNVGLMEDRATLRISAQHIANWLHHGIVTQTETIDAFERMAKIVDEQNAGDPLYRDMCRKFDDCISYSAALDMVFRGREVINGYTEPVLNERRKMSKAMHGY